MPEIPEASAEPEATLVETPEAQAPETELAAEPALEPDRVLSIEEQLAEATLEVETPTEKAVTEETGVTTTIPDTVWNIPKVAQPTQRIRFAEDIMAPRATAPDEGRRRGGRPARAGEGEPGRPYRRSRRTDYPVDEDDADQIDGAESDQDEDQEPDDLAP